MKSKYRFRYRSQIITIGLISLENSNGTFLSLPIPFNYVMTCIAGNCTRSPLKMKLIAKNTDKQIIT